MSRRRDVGSVLASRHAKPQAVPVLSFVQRVVAIDPNLTQSDQLITHIKKHNLKLEEYLTTRSNGDCFYDALFNLVKLNNLPIPTSNPLELRRFIISSLDSNPNFQLWLSSPTVWRQSQQIFKEFKIRHSKPGVFTDNLGIILYAACHSLKVNISIVSSSNNAQNPVTEFFAPEGSAVTFFIGYYQDTTDGSTGEMVQSGHYISLQRKPDQTHSQPSLQQGSREVLEKIKAEMTILDMLAAQETIVRPSLGRLELLKVGVADLRESGICSLLYTKIYPVHSSETEAGRSVRVLLRRFEDALRADGMIGESLNVTRCSSEQNLTGNNCQLLHRVSIST